MTVHLSISYGLNLLIHHVLMGGKERENLFLSLLASSLSISLLLYCHGLWPIASENRQPMSGESGKFLFCIPPVCNPPVCTITASPSYKRYQLVLFAILRGNMTNISVSLLNQRSINRQQINAHDLPRQQHISQ